MNEAQPTTGGLTPGPSPFVRASCGCIGLHFGSATEYLCIKRCDGDYQDDSYDLFIRNVDPEKEFIPLSPADTNVLMANLSKLVNMGNRLNDLLSIVNRKYPFLEELPGSTRCQPTTETPQYPA